MYFFKEEINYLAHQVSKEGVQPSDSNLKAVTECAPPQTYTEMCAFLGLVGHYWQFIKGFTHILQLLNKCLTAEGASRKFERISPLESTLQAFKVLKGLCMTTPILTFANYTKPLLLETDVSKNGLGLVLSPKQMDGRYPPVGFGSRALTSYERNYHSMKLEFLALQGTVMEHFKEYLPYQPFLVKTDNNPLTYIMMTPNLDATGHQWVGSLARFTFQLEYQKGCDNTVVDVPIWVTTHLNPDMVRSILNGVPLWAAHHVKVQNPTVIKGDHGFEQEVNVATGHALVQMYVTDWAKAQNEDPVPSAGFDWLEAQKRMDLRMLLAEHASSEEGRLIVQNWQNFMIHHKALYLCSTPKGKSEDLLLSWSQGCIGLPPWTDIIGMQDIRAMTILYPYYRNAFGGRGWPISCGKPSKPAHIAYNMRAVCPRVLYTLLWPPFPWISYI